ncbi:uncharacterized protein JCM6883_006939 [Sporobolomyces salmoneus]|uniref:uncharacterized protein n=1 Tax=Sporobolomyces salmoneus TaxID=183962 RepID=UPI003172D129
MYQHELDETGLPREHTVCEDLLLAILEQAPSKQLVPLRRVSRLFGVLVDEVLRARFVKMATCQDTAIILESCAPYNSREPSRQVLVFSHFVDPALPFAAMVAHFDVATRHPHYLPLDDNEVFANNILGVTLESMEPAPLEFLTTQPRTFNIPYAPSTGNGTLPQRFFSDFSWQLPLASSLDRLFRDWFCPESPTQSKQDQGDRRSSFDSAEGDDDVLSRSPSSRESTPPPVVSTPPRSRLQRINLSNHWPTSSRVPSAFVSASLECFSHEGARPPPVYLLGPPPSVWGPLEFEYYFDSICLDVGKVLVAAEEGLKGKHQSPFVLFA